MQTKAPSLVVEFGSTRKLATVERGLTLGRSRRHDISFEDERVSSSHGRIWHRAGRYFYQDTHSCNGTCIVPEGGVERRLHQTETSVDLGSAGQIILPDGTALAYRLAEAGHLEQRFLEARGLIDCGRHIDAYAILQDLIEADHPAAEVHRLAGACAALRKPPDMGRAIGHYETFLARQPGDLDAWIDLGELYRACGQFASAQRCFGRVAPGASQYPRALTCLGQIDKGPSNDLALTLQQPDADLIPAEATATVRMPPFAVTFGCAAHGRIANDVLKALAFGRTKVARYLSLPMQGTIPVRILVAWERSGGRATADGIDLLVPAVQPELPMVIMTAVHEYAHFALGVVAGFGQNVPWWLQEGFAQSLSQHLSPDRLESIRDLAGPGLPMALKRYGTGPGSVLGPETAQEFYTVAHAAATCLLGEYPQDSFQRLARALGMGRNMKDAFKSIGTSERQFEQVFGDWLSRSLKAGAVKLTRPIG